ncbi:MAG: sigma 54-interacting transcriptional regulator [Pseudodesulfovibrio sp.]|nr:MULTISPECIES: sigma 54-interacting transcriptional regulator [Pseudodesulfovibrio]MBU4244385.1 sigma 54-interacting transcriptional regulator [Pseudomonadota bacterium]MBU4378761.1 sigma 54-interacting transcriptional regulator [Pseudomonadota bacterium]MBU4475790.1 sigma 54-interacting transcriptional regulator [Pseudomonadota bacterium]MBU4522576.1 sigma 54-interacting transcriptional regulator [Pseudomonadota bacterium]MBU4557619.1 sigma 54-interacting transcriptional regulator [Pseudomo
MGILLITGYLNYQISNRYTEIGLERTARLQALAMAHEVEIRLGAYRQELLFIAHGQLDAQSLRDHLARKDASGGLPVRELAFFSPELTGHIFMVACGSAAFEVPEPMLHAVKPSHFLHFEALSRLAPGEVMLFPVEEAEYPFPLETNANNRVFSPVIRMATVVPVGDSGQRGYLFLGFEARELRNILSIFNSTRSPLHAFSRSNELRFSYMIDTDGWMLFQSESIEQSGAEISTMLARGGHEGTLGKPGLATAFLPDKADAAYWDMITDIRAGQQNCLILKDQDKSLNQVNSHFLAYAPVRFYGGGGGQAQVVGGIAFVDRSQLTLVAGYRHLDVMFIITITTIGIMTLLVYLLSRYITLPIFQLARAVRDMDLTRPEEVELPAAGFETNNLKAAVNSLVARLRDQMEQTWRKDQELLLVSMQERASIDESHTDGGAISPLPEIIGSGVKIAQMKSDILKAARVDVDVLVVGETGTGKQLAAEAIHNHSARSGRPFISINCGALDENLLLDTLFGHTKGAYTEAKGERKGAFLEADGGTLFLDEIQATSPMGQQALLRAIAMRKIKPLGSDREVDVNVRLIAATNVDLTAMIEDRTFREDLYYRLRVLTINVPPLREHRESIPSLALYYLRQAEALVGKVGLALSRGAIEKMNAYGWPGNIRELVNCITRAAVMVENEVIQANDIQLEEERLADWHPLTLSSVPVAAPAAAWGGDVSADPPFAAAATPSAKPASGPDPALHPSGIRLNERQSKVYPLLVARGGITRSEYQDFVGDGLPSRTAIYDLNDLVKKGCLVKVGSGPATRYELKMARKPSRN